MSFTSPESYGLQAFHQVDEDCGEIEFVAHLVPNPLVAEHTYITPIDLRCITMFFHTQYSFVLGILSFSVFFCTQ